MTDEARSGDGARPDGAAGGVKGPDELRQQIERTRSQLGDTVEELAGKMDVKGRAQARAADLRDKAGAMAVQLRSTVAQAGHAVQGRAAQTGHAVQDKAAQTGHAVQDKAARAEGAGLRHPGSVLFAGAAAGAVGGVVALEVLRRRYTGRR
ncbi:DUF3618 domain-containing protein [Streptomyces glaucus]|uniref:DUF3618 domain-containing protein n=1 Tax=Streptomyces glaucus TaxID=284029 RepID=A0ABN3JF49_9ACTN